MQRFLKNVSLVCLMALVAVPALADDAKKAEKKGEKKVAKGEGGPDIVAAMLKKLEKAGLSEEQVGKIKAMGAEVSTKVADARKKAGLSKEQQQARKAAMEKAKADGKSGKELQAAAEAAAELTADQKAALKEAQEIQGGFNKSVMALLSDEQKEKVGLAGPKKPGAKKPAGEKKPGEKKPKADKAAK